MVNSKALQSLLMTKSLISVIKMPSDRTKSKHWTSFKAKDFLPPIWASRNPKKEGVGGMGTPLIRGLALSSLTAGVSGSSRVRARVARVMRGHRTRSWPVLVSWHWPNWDLVGLSLWKRKNFLLWDALVSPEGFSPLCLSTCNSFD